MIWLEDALPDAEGPLVQRLGFAVLPLGAIRFGLIIQHSRHLRMVRPEDLLDHCGSALIQGFCLGILPLISVDEGEAGEAGGDVEMLRAKGLFADAEGALVQCFRLRIPLLCTVEFGEFVQTWWRYWDGWVLTLAPGALRPVGRAVQLDCTAPAPRRGRPGYQGWKQYRDASV